MKIAISGMMLALAVAVAPTAIAQAYPSKPVRIVVNFPPGGAADQLGRALGARLQAAQPAQLEKALGDVGAGIVRQLDALADDVKRLDASLLSALERARDKAVEEVGRFAAKVRKTIEDREGTGLRQVRRLCTMLRPRGRLQERVLPCISVLATHGKATGQLLVDAADPFATGHGVLEL